MALTAYSLQLMLTASVVPNLLVPVVAVVVVAFLNMSIKNKNIYVYCSLSASCTYDFHNAAYNSAW